MGKVEGMWGGRTCCRHTIVCLTSRVHCLSRRAPEARCVEGIRGGGDAVYYIFSLLSKNNAVFRYAGGHLCLWKAL